MAKIHQLNFSAEYSPHFRLSQ